MASTHAVNLAKPTNNSSISNNNKTTTTTTANSSSCSSSNSNSTGTSASTTTNNDNNNNNNNDVVVGSARNEVKSSDSNVSRDNMRLHRLARSIKNTKRPDATKPIIEGWLRHTTLSDERAKQHYWRLDEHEITMYENDTSKRYFKAIPLGTITRVMSSRSLPKSVREDLLARNELVSINSALDSVTQLYFNTLGLEKLANSPTYTKFRDKLLSPLHHNNNASKANKEQNASNTKQAKSATTSPTKSPELQAQMNAIFAFEQVSGSMYLVQAQTENEASKWRQELDAITMSKRLEEGKPLISSSSSGTSFDKEKQQSPAKIAAKDKPEEELLLMMDAVELSTPSKIGQQVEKQAVGGATLVAPPTKAQDSSTASLPIKCPKVADLATAAQPQTTSAAKSTAAAAAAGTTTTTTTATTNTDATISNQLDKSKPAPSTTSTVCSEQPPSEAKTAAPPKQPQRQHHHHYPPSSASRAHKTYTDPSRSRLYNRPRITIQLDSMSIPDHWIEGKYLIERDRQKGVGFEELGSGQFGKVYAAISELKVEDATKGLWSGVPVAIKEISKARFDLRQQAKFKNEANILSRLDHPGVIILERVHDLPDKIYIVMEQLEDDMLEMIVSTEEKRLNERITKFLTYQILEALKYLHAQNIAHCDLKPENVLLVERRSQFPQIKLCDFGFAKIIEENSFRSSLVGTPAYLAPEVVKGERYNRSVDLWSVGVIVYVSLSGEFPFNEGENIHDQISRATFMWPDQPWAKLSPQSKAFINSLLKINGEKRLSASRAQMDEWIQDYTLWCDLSELEVRVGKRWVTDDADYDRWTRYAKKHNLQIPRAAVQLHEELLAD